MTLFEFIILLFIAAICGGIGQTISGYSFGGCLISAGVGFIGAVIGNWLASELGLPILWSVDISGSPFPIVWSIIGAAIFSGVIGAIFKARAKA